MKGQSMPTYLLVHGAWTGAHVWDPLRAELCSRGHRVSVPDLTGLGALAHVRDPDIDLDRHAEDVIAVLECDDLRDVVLVGHSYGGAVVTVVADRLPHRITRLVYLDALVPRDGESVNDLRRTPVREGWLVPERFAALGPVRAARAMKMARLCPQPPRTFSQQVRLVHADAALTQRCTYIRPAGRHASPAYDRAADFARCSPDWDYHELPGRHDLMVTNPRGVADLLERVMDGSGATS